MSSHVLIVEGYIVDGSIPRRASASKTSGEADFTASVRQEWEVSGIIVELEYDHTFPHDLKITLLSPKGTAATLVDRGGKSERLAKGKDRNTVVFDDSAGAAIDATTPIPLDGTFRPASPLSAFNGESMNGEWKLHINDEAGSDIGEMKSWKLILRTGQDFWRDCSQSPIHKLHAP